MELASGEQLASVSSLNPQAVFGGDLMSRIAFAQFDPGNLRKLQTRIIGLLNQHIEQVARESGVLAKWIYKVVDRRQHLHAPPAARHRSLVRRPRPLCAGDAPRRSPCPRASSSSRCRPRRACACSRSWPASWAPTRSRWPWPRASTNARAPHRGRHRHQRRGAARLARAAVGVLGARRPRARGRADPPRHARGARAPSTAWASRTATSACTRSARPPPRGSAAPGSSTRSPPCSTRASSTGPGSSTWRPRAAARAPARAASLMRGEERVVVLARARRSRARRGRSCSPRTTCGRCSSARAPSPPAWRCSSTWPASGPTSVSELMLAGGFGNYLSVRSALRIGLIPPDLPGGPDPLRRQRRRAGRAARAGLGGRARAGRGDRRPHRARLARRASRLRGHLRGLHELPRTPRLLGARAVRLGLMRIPAGLVGTTVGPRVHGDRRALAHGLRRRARRARRPNTSTRRGRTASSRHPLFPVCYEWPLARRAPGQGAARRGRGARASTRRTISRLHRRPRAGDRLSTTATVVAVGAAHARRLRRHAHGDRRRGGPAREHDRLRLASTAAWSATRAPRPDPLPRGETGRPDPRPSAQERRTRRREWSVDRRPDRRHGLAHVYTECARIWNPIHTDRAVAPAPGCPTSSCTAPQRWPWRSPRCSSTQPRGAAAPRARGDRPLHRAWCACPRVIVVRGHGAAAVAGGRRGRVSRRSLPTAAPRCATRRLVRGGDAP